MVFKLLKKLFSPPQQESEDAGPRFPREFFAVRWNHVARTKGVGGDRNKNLVRVEQGVKKQKYPYAGGAILEAAKKELNMPHIDETGGQNVPVYDKLAEYLPNLIAHNPSNLRKQ